MYGVAEELLGLVGDRIDDVVEVAVLVQVADHQRADGDDALARCAGRLQGLADQDRGQSAAFVAVVDLGIANLA